jgi:pimeloyl-ACP methyl ester carboxylesterase
MHDYLLVHGAFSDASVWQTLVPHLESSGARVTAITLPGHGASDTAAAGGVTMDAYVASVVAALDASASSVILVGHSLGGMTISGAAEARPEKVAACVYISAALPESGKTLLDYTGTDTQSKLGAHLEVDAEHGIVTVGDAGKREALCNRSDATATAIALSFTYPQPLQPFATPLVLTPERFGSVARYYVATTDDNAIGYELQKRMYDAQPCAHVFSIDTDHMAMLSATADVAKALRDVRTAVGSAGSR